MVAAEQRETGGVMDMVMVVRRESDRARKDIWVGWESKKPRNESFIYEELETRIGSPRAESLESIEENACTMVVGLLECAKIEVLNAGF